MAIDPRIFENTAFPSGPGLDVVGGLGQFAATLLPILNLLMQQQQFGQAQQGVVSQPFDPNRDYAVEIFQALQPELNRRRVQDPASLMPIQQPDGTVRLVFRPDEYARFASVITGLPPEIIQPAYEATLEAFRSLGQQELERFGGAEGFLNMQLERAARTAIPSLERERFEQTLAEQQRQFDEELALRQRAQQLAEQQAQADLALRLAQIQSQLAADPFARLSFQLGLTGGQAASDPVRVSEIFFNRLQSGQLGPVPGAAAPGLPGVFMPQGTFAPGQVAPGTTQLQPLPAPPTTGGPFAQTTSSPTERLQSLIQNVTPRSIAAGFGQATPSQRTAALSLFRQAGRDVDDALQEIESFTPTRQGSTTTFFSF